ncbi:hypothetical protein COM04_28535 [Bacillus wiedmannii]|nr:hypothetical protein CN573_27390 [Bacillus wiedmannii]PGB89184.1 hypothetical protein COM04_28535 [Bacillus wiedmannii]PGC17965.1 hypothetical protein COM23_28870 [Bacillus wiedmannii]PHB67769.1 hypothetical protein COE89_27055 [Bacillus wiedmannii]
MPGSKISLQNSAKEKKLGGDQLPVNARLVRADNHWGMKPPMIKASLYLSVSKNSIHSPSGPAKNM